MPKKNTNSKPRRRTRRSKPLWKRFFSFLVSPPGRRLVLFIIALVLLYIFVPRLLALGARAWENCLELFGIGLLIAAAAIGVFVWMITRKSLSNLAKRWNWFLGGIALALAVWGILAFFSPGQGAFSQATLGGKIGQSIIGSRGVMGGLRAAGLILLGVILFAPRKSAHAVKNGWRSLRKVSLPRPKISRRGKAPASKQETVSSPAPAASETLQPQRESVLTPGGWRLPTIDILDKPTEIQLDESDIEQRARLIEEALASYGVEAKVVQINIGPTVTQFGVEPGWDRKYREIREKGKDGSYQTKLEEVSRTRVRVERITSLANDLALALAAPSIRIEAPVPGKPVIGIEVPNATFGSVSLRSVIESAAFQKIKAKSKLAIALGKGAGGESVAADLAKMPHLLIAGATGSGKTVCLDSIICCLLFHNSPDDVRFIMIDPKRVELTNFNGIPHLLAPVVVDADKAIKALRWLSQEMDARYRQFAQAGARNIEGYNKDRPVKETLPYIVLIIDELADLMMAAFDEVEHTLCRLAQLARATGIHLIVATQRPSVDVVTGLIKANFPTRISFAVTSQVDSRTILDIAGAEKLLGKGDMLYMPTEASKPKRLQGTFVSDAEMERLVHFWGNQHKLPISFVNFDEVADLSAKEKTAPIEDPLLEEATRLAQEYKNISVSFLQRRLHIGYPRAARLMEMLQETGVVKEPQAKTEKS